MRFEFATATRIIFGPGTIAEIGPLARELGCRALVVTGRNSTRAAPLLDRLADAGITVEIFPVAQEPVLADITRGVAQARTDAADFVIGFGGGAALDSAKAIAALATNDGDILDFLEVVGRARPITRAGLPCIAIPTTAGTGSEVTRNAVLTASAAHSTTGPAPSVKVSLRSPHLLPRVALVDPALTLDLPPALTATTGLDALTQLIEPYVCLRSNPLTDPWCVEGMRRAARSLQRAFSNGADLSAREDLALASLYGGLALANAGLGAVHGLAGPIGGMFSAPHGAVCAALLPHVMAANLQALRARAAGHPAIARYDEIGRFLTGKPNASAEDGVAWIRQLVGALDIPSLAHLGVTREDFSAIAAAALQASSMKANPIALTAAELGGILAAAS